MRKITYKDYVKVGEIDDIGKAYVAGKWELREQGKAVFHQFSHSCDEEDSHPVAIIELPDGSVKVVRAEHIQFVRG